MAWAHRARARAESTPAPPPMAAMAAARAWSPPAPLDAWSADVFRRIEWRRFEAVVEALYAQAGFETRSQPHGADGGVDIWLYSKHHANGGAPVSIVQCKHWVSWSVGVKPVRELRGVMAQHGIPRGQFVTTSRFTEEARAFARDSGVALHDTDGLLDLIAQRDAGQQRALLETAFDGDYWCPTCARCGVKMVERTARETGKHFWGCATFPKCRSRLEMPKDLVEPAESAGTGHLRSETSLR